MGISGEKMEDILNALQDFISDKLPAIAECNPTPAEVCYALHHLAWCYHWGHNQMTQKRR